MYYKRALDESAGTWSLKTKQKQRQFKKESKKIQTEKASEELESISNGEFDPGSG